MQAVLIVIHLIVAMGLIFAVLLQRSEGGALGMGGGGSGLGGLFSPRGAANTLTRTTVILGVLFFATSMALTMLTLGSRTPTSIVNVPGAPGSAPVNPNAPPPLPQSLPAAPGGAAVPAPAAGGAASPAGPPALPSLPPTR